METMLVRLKRFEPRRGLVLRRFTYAGIKFYEERGWYRVEKAVAEYLRSVREQSADPHAPLAFDVCTEDEAHAQEAKDHEAASARKAATDEIKLSIARPVDAVTAADVLEPAKHDGRPRKDRG